ncbi:sigma-70 family RNA polymerase sigma factor [Chitinophaga rhizosphaerae]|uniref:sigma-70 family RNA polymerase sigma factor n=1 Tax=Chitinophaga rhizosphaerae TaxID=1864947 RepID=UPI000F8123FC|nr:sigma-70 family RNA polymerase sigma factor [Chitinophaga rhizosphaerae]
MTFADQPNDLLQLLRQGDAAAFEYIYTAFRKWLWVAALGILENEAEAEEIVQEFFLDYWQKEMQREFTDLRHLKGFLYVSVRNRCFNRLERNKVMKKRQAQLPIPGKVEANDRIAEKELQERLKTAIGKLPEMRGKVFLMGYILHRSRREIALALRISEESVKKHMTLALRDLRGMLK